MSLLEKIFGKRKAPDALAEVPRAWDEASERLWRIHGKLERSRKADVRLMTFGSSHHRYRTTPVPLEEIERFEQENGIELPSELREILHYIGCGAGPYYGLYTLEAMRRVFDEWSSFTGSSSSLAGASQLSDATVRDIAERRAADPQGYHSFSVTTVNGALPLLTEGCTYYRFVVLTGEQEGKVWALDTNEMNAMPVGHGQGVFDLYEDWLDAGLRALDTKG